MKKVDLVFKNANILTLDSEGSIRSSVAVLKGKIVYIWEDKEPPNDVITSKTEVVDLQGKTLIPGFIDTHNHLLMYSQYLDQINCGSPLNKNIGDILDRINTESMSKRQGEWIIGWGYDDTLLEENRHPTRKELDSVSPDHPVLIRHISSHFAVVNSVALRIAGISDNVEDPQGGHFGRNKDGSLDGVLYEFGAMDLVDKVIPDYTKEELVNLIENGANDYLKQGITTNTDAGVGLVKGFLEYEAHVEAVAKEKNPMRMRFMILHHLLYQGAPFEGLTFEQLNEKVRNDTNYNGSLDSAKLFQDGSIQGLTGALRDPYFCNPNITGELSHAQNEFNEEVLDLHKRGFRIATHGNGDRAIGSILDAYSYALDKVPKPDHRHRIEHVQTATREDLNRMKGLGVEASFFINHVYYWGERHRSIFLGEERANRLNPLKDAQERGFKFTLHSDCPITPISPLFSIWAAVNRVTSDGRTLGEEQKIDVTTALKAMTIYGAWLNFEEQEVGSIEVGKLADFAVLDKDPTSCNPIEIKEIEVLATYIGGKRVYNK
ncbi:amidohydrolase [Halobacillus halophilus]|uniref:amidohydrolase n=1 Tax=Halobacillus halophilus TaxID=1570 RepID=UPI001CD26BEF|nr:amidohydrolase [Halobacillus halophilus]MCA1010712.1 amidohydrolase [Halobacillus halophilus]